MPPLWISVPQALHTEEGCDVCKTQSLLEVLSPVSPFTPAHDSTLLLCFLPETFSDLVSYTCYQELIDLESAAYNSGFNSSVNHSRRTMSSTSRLRSLNIDNINPHCKAAQYAVRGELAIKSEEYRAQLKKGDPPTPPESPLPFDSVISANIGNPQQLDQKPLTFFRQVLALCENSKLLEHPDTLKSVFGYPQDAIDRARWLLKEIGSVGAYSQSAGNPSIRESVANFIERRDGFPSDPKSVYLSAGASSGVNTLLHIISGSPVTGVLVPIPQVSLIQPLSRAHFHQGSTCNTQGHSSTNLLKVSFVYCHSIHSQHTMCTI